MSINRIDARPEDGKDILRILESSAAKGLFELLYTRRPDAYESYMKESGEVRVFVSRNKESPICTCAEIIRPVYIGGREAKAAYICGLKKEADRKGTVGFFGTELIRSLQRDDIDYYYCSVISDNDEALKTFSRFRTAIAIKPICNLRTYIISPKVRMHVPKNDLVVRDADKNDTEALLEFLRSEGIRKELFPVVDSIESFHNLSIEDFRLLTDKNGRILAAAALWNQTEYKQYVVKKYRGVMKLARVLNPIIGALGYIRLPKQDEPLDFPMLAFLCVREDRAEYFNIFFDGVLRELKKEKRPMLVIGAPRAHFASRELDKLRSVHFDSKICEITFPRKQREYGTPDPQNVFPECALL